MPQYPTTAPVRVLVCVSLTFCFAHLWHVGKHTALFLAHAQPVFFRRVDDLLKDLDAIGKMAKERESAQNSSIMVKPPSFALSCRPLVPLHSFSRHHLPLLPCSLSWPFFHSLAYTSLYRYLSLVHLSFSPPPSLSPMATILASPSLKSHFFRGSLEEGNNSLVTPHVHKVARKGHHREKEKGEPHHAAAIHLPVNAVHL